jgi:ATP-binding protein involved in chromosome partitioning
LFWFLIILHKKSFSFNFFLGILSQFQEVSMPTEKEVFDALKNVYDPDLGKDLVSLGMIQDLKIQGSKVTFTILLTTPACPLKAKFKKEAEEAIKKVSGIKEVEVKMDARVTSFKKIPTENLIPGVKTTIAIGSGKGGVGKSTVAVNLALALQKTGAKVGLLDADIYGPTIPQLLGINARATGKDNRIFPLEKFNLKIISLGFFIPPGEPVIWRGPLVAGAIQQFLRDVDWGELDYMIIDLPPGTGDAQLTLAQIIPLSGVVMVTTPQDVAKKIAVKSLLMFQKLQVSILGIIENMSYFLCPHCGKRTDIFSTGGGKKTAEELCVPFLGEIPLDLALRETADLGKPFFIDQPNSRIAEIFSEIAGRLAQKVSILSHAEKEI